VTSEQPSTLAAAVDEYHRGEAFSFHMPGHKQQPGALHPEARRLFGDALIANDLSEMGGFDYLHAPDSSIATAQQRAADVFGAARTWFLVNGSTGGNLAAITALTGDGDRLVMLRASHRSVYGGAVLAGAQPEYVPMMHDRSEDGWFLGDASLLSDLRPGDAALLHITRPNYYGMAADLTPWVEAARRLDIALIVDEAHGSHFAFDNRLPESALAAGADIAIQSTHKTLGGLTQASMLHVSERGLRWADRIGRSLQQTQSSSPSALLSISLDLAADHLRTDGLAKVASAVDLGEHVAASVPAPLRVVRSHAASTDPTKVVIDVRGLRMTGFDASAWLRTHHRIWIELADQHRIVCSLTIGDTPESAGALVTALQQLSAVAPQGGTGASSPTWVTPTASMLPRRALQASVESVSITNAVDRIAAEYVIPYPPGIPLAVPGEILTVEVLNTLAQYQAIGSRIVGPNDPTVANLLVVQ
jgi:arginine decarboxylase